MLEYLETLGVTGSALVVVVAIIAAAELVQASRSLWAFLADRFLGFKTRYTLSRERDALIYKNKEDLDRFVQSQEEFNSKINSDIKDLHDLMRDVSDSVIQIKISSMRSTILDFASAVSSGRVYTKEQFKYILKLHRQYEDEVEKRGIDNNEVTLSMEIINQAYSKSLKNRNFIEDRMNDPSFQDKVRTLLSQ
jgi:hypothetical protein